MTERVVSVQEGQPRQRPVMVEWSLRLGLACSLAMLAVLMVWVWGGARAWAAAPEAPETQAPTEVTAEFAFLHGVLNPKSTGELGGSYQFLYNVGSTCVGGTRTPESPEIASGVEHEEVSTPVFPLSPNTEYTVCLVAINAALEETMGSPVTVETAIPPETPETKSATEVTATTATLNGVLNPKNKGEAGSYEFRYLISATECEGGGEKGAPEPRGAAAGNLAEAVSVKVTGLLPATQYTACLLARNQPEERALGEPGTFTTSNAAPSVGEESFSKLGSTTVTVAAEMDPDGLPTIYHVEYVTEAQFVAHGFEGATSVPASGAELPATNTAIAVREELGGLEAATLYHFRFVASNPLGVITGADATFTTANSGGGALSLPDNRAYELVSSAAIQGEVYDPIGVFPPFGETAEADASTERPFRAAADGSAVAYVGDPEPDGGNGASGNGLGNEYVASRGAKAGPEGWESSAITPRAAEGETANQALETRYESFSEDLSVGFLRSNSQPLAAAAEPQGPANCWVMYSHTTGDGRYHALFSSTQTPGFCGTANRDDSPGFRFAGASADGSQMLFQTPAVLTADAAQTVGEGNNLYDSVGGVPRLVNVLPDGEANAHATFGGPGADPNRGHSPDFSGVISSDGSRIAWSTVEGVEEGEGHILQQPKALYVRENAAKPQSPIGGGGECTVAADACTLQVDAAQAGAEGSSGGGRFWTASSDGSKVFFTDCNRLTEDSTAVSTEGCEHLEGTFKDKTVLTGGDLYEYDFAKPAGARLTDLTVDHDGGDLLGADVQGVVGASEDGSYIYFVAGGALESEENGRKEKATNRKCEESPGSTEEQNEEIHGHLPAGKGCNLYLWRAGQPLRFIAALAAKDDELVGQGLADNRYGDWAPGLAGRTAEVSGDGSHLVLESTQRLTGYDNSVLGSDRESEGGLEVFVYSAGSGRFSCASCDPGGAPPDVAIEANNATGAGTHLPVSSSNTFMRRWMNGEGTEVFFDSSQPLVSQDTNRQQDVYEWEAEGAGGCPTQTPARLDGGCVFLLSGGGGSDFSYFVDASANGSDVFLTHRGRLGQAGPLDDKTHLYDARVGGGFPQTSLACTGTGCQGVPPAPPLFATPASATFSGAGNFPPPTPSSKSKPKPKAKSKAKCKRGFVKKRGKCVKKGKGKKKTKAVKSSRGGKS
jgi:hypothetical protein